ncbi:Endoplasmic reticulum-Golgi intermediate compartment protein 3, partial [Cucurbita argyrosperma subsp. argyrosperma]
MNWMGGLGCNITITVANFWRLSVKSVLPGNFHFAPGKSFKSDVHRVVPTVYKDVSGNTIQSNQFSVTEHVRTAEVGRLQSLPAVFFFYDLSPIKVTFTEEHVSFLHFLTNVCAIVGGVFTVSGILDSFIYHGQKVIKKKMELGKFS